MHVVTMGMRYTALLSAIIYLVLGGLWIGFSDRALLALVDDAERLSTLQTYKGWAFVTLTAVLAYLLVRRVQRYAYSLHEAEQRQALGREVLEMVVQGRPLAEILNRLVLGVELFEPDMLGSILLLDEDGVHVRYGAAPSLPDAYNQAIDGEPIGPKAGSCGTAAWRREPVTVTDIAGDPLWEDYRDAALAHGLRACWSTPILDPQGGVLGTFAMYYREPRAPEPWHQSLIEHATGLAAVAIGRSRAEQALRESETRFRTLFEQAGDGIFLINAGNRYLDANPTGQAMLGYSREELLNMTVADVLVASERPRLQVEPKEMMAGRPHLAEWDHLRKDGSVFPAEVSARRLTDDSYIAIVRDLTERRRAEIRLRESEERLRLAVDASSIGLWDWDLRTNLVHFSPEWKHQLGYDDDEITNRFEEWQGRVHPDDLKPTLERVRAALENTCSGRYEAEFRLRHKDGGYRWIYTRANVLRDHSGDPVRVLGCHIDITARKQAEEDIRTLNAELEQRVAARTAELAALNKELETFAYSVSHDLKAPLRGIDGYSRLLLEEHAGQLDEEGRLFATNIRAGAAQMGHLIDDLLAYSRAERRALEPRTLDLAALVEAVHAERAAAIAQAGAEVSLTVPALTARADREGVVQALRNLLDNALKFAANAQPPRIEIGGRSGNGSSILWVKDNGIGFDMTFHDRIFEIFQRLQRVEEYPGTGIGLAIVHKAVQRMGGRVWAESAPGKGATFYLELPQ